MASKAAELTDDTFADAMLKSAEPVLVDFWAPWCPPCRAMAPAIDQMADENRGAATVGKLNIDEHPQAALRYSVDKLPTVMIFKDGHPVAKLVGARSKSQLQAALDEAKG